MKSADRNSLFALPILIIVSGLFAFAGSQGGSLIAGLPLFGSLVGLIFLIQWLAFIPAFMLQTEKFYDLTGSVTYITVITIALAFSAGIDARAILLWALVVIWAIRLGAFLFGRIQKAGKDDRFDRVKTSFAQFLVWWTIQALWITITIGAALAAVTSSTRKELDGYASIGLLLWVFGFTFEVVSDIQKSRFAADLHNRGKFIQTGLWSRSRHPNYFGEIVLWIGVAVIAWPVLQGWQWVALISPVFVILLITRVSGVPLLEKKAEKKWGGQSDYESYRKSTPELVPWFRQGKR